MSDVSPEFGMPAGGPWPAPAEAFYRELMGQRPRVAIVGAKGGGKSIYRLALSNQLCGLPPYLEGMFGLEGAPWGGEAGQTLNFSTVGEGSGWSWVDEGRALMEKRVREHVDFLPRLEGTDWITRHRIALPQLKGGGCLLDFPGEYPSRPDFRQAQLAPHSQPLLELTEHVVRQCDLVVMMVPFWILFPPSMLQAMPPHRLALARRLAGGARAGGDPRRDWMQVTDRVLATTQAWIGTLRRVARKQSTLAVVFTMLGEDWPLYLSPESNWSAGRPSGQDAARELVGHLQAVRDAIAHPLAQGHRPRAERVGRHWSGPFSGLARHASGHVEVAELGILVNRVDAHMRRAIGASQELWRQGGGSTGGDVVSGLTAVLDAWSGPQRFLAMNVITERDVLVKRVGTDTEITHFRTDIAGGILPALLLAGSLNA